GRWTYAWDGENRLLGMTSLSNAPGGSKMQLGFSYDYQGRRIAQVVSTNNGSAYVGESTNYYVYDGWNCVAICNPSLALLDSFLWGSDLSGSAQGAGGVGGLIAMTVYGGTNAGTYFYSYDGNGNATALVNATNGATVAHYEYGPFGRLIGKWGRLADANRYRFSSKEYQPVSGLYNYGFRFYEPNFSRWLNRDPIQELGGINLYGFEGNDPVDLVDLLGLDAVFTFVSGGSKSAATAGQFASLANNAANNSISQITVTGHAAVDSTGGASIQDIGLDETQGHILVNAQGSVVVMDPQSNLPDPSLTNLLASKMATNGSIVLKGCKSGVPTDPNNIAKAISKDLPGISVTGQNQNLNYIPWTYITVPIPFYNTTTTYLNGQPK
ncbi:MAG: RHS repeat-associated core domain-containing protein, partial [Limisphaerales bacterium]